MWWVARVGVLVLHAGARTERDMCLAAWLALR